MMKQNVIDISSYLDRYDGDENIDIDTLLKSYGTKPITKQPLDKRRKRNPPLSILNTQKRYLKRNTEKQIQEIKDIEIEGVIKEYLEDIEVKEALESWKASSRYLKVI